MPDVRIHVRRRGMALVMVLWMLTLLCALALEVALVSRLRLQATRNSGEGVRALFLARAGVARAIADLKAAGRTVTLDALRQNEQNLYESVELGSGTYTLLAAPAKAWGDLPEFGICDEAARVNINTADEEMLTKVPGMDPNIASAIVALRGDNGEFYNLDDLLQIEGVDALVLYGEDQNRNGILDPNEDDGDQSWPPDNMDGVLDPGLAAYLTCHSAVRNVDSSGRARVNLNSADAAQIAAQVAQISQQQAQSIVEHRKQHQLQTIADLLDVMLVEQVGRSAQGNAGTPASSSSAAPRPSGGATRPGLSSGPSGQSGGGQTGGAQGGGGSAGGGQGPRFRTTSSKAFDVAALKSFADRVTTADEEVLKGLINVNTAPPEVLACLPGVDHELAVAIAETAAETPLENVAQLLDVPGMTTDIFKGICNKVCVSSDVFSVRSFGVLVAADGMPETYCCVHVVLDRTSGEFKIKSWRELR